MGCKGICRLYRSPLIMTDFYPEGFTWCSTCERPIPHESRSGIKCHCCKQRTRIAPPVKKSKNKRIFATLLQGQNKGKVILLPTF